MATSIDDLRSDSGQLLRTQCGRQGDMAHAGESEHQLEGADKANDTAPLTFFETIAGQSDRPKTRKVYCTVT